MENHSIIKDINSIIKDIIKICYIYVLWIIVHFVASHLYVRLCTPNTIIGFLLSPLLVTSPHCISLRWLIYNGSLNINNMWVLLGAWIITKISCLHPQ
jgi:hypothetical protein